MIKMKPVVVLLEDQVIDKINKITWIGKWSRSARIRFIIHDWMDKNGIIKMKEPKNDEEIDLDF